jgi:hypothetical protein
MVVFVAETLWICWILFSFYLGFKTEATLFPSVLSTSDSQQLTGVCYYDKTKYEGQQDAMFSAACIA